VAVVAISVVLGSRLLSADDRLTTVSVAASDIAVGAGLAEVELRTVQVKVSDDVAATLLGPGTDLAGSSVFTRPVKAGELVPRAALVARADPGLVQVPISVDPDQVPPSVVAGAVVDVYVLERGERSGHDAEPALEAASVVAAPDPSSTVVSTGRRQLVVAVPDARARAFFAALGAAEQATVTVVRRQ
jgi:hypothetical protein